MTEDTHSTQTTPAADAAAPAQQPAAPAPGAAGPDAPPQPAPPQSAPPPDAPPQPAPPGADIAAARKEAADNYDRYVRAVADLENFRRRSLREKDELRQYATGRVLEDMFPIIEALALGIEAAGKPGAEIAQVVDGMGMVLNQIKTTLGHHGLKEINPAPGGQFDPHRQEAIAMQPSADIAEGRVLQVFRAGYALNDRVLRPAAVVVSSGTGTTQGKN